MDSKELGFLFRIALSCALDNSRCVSMVGQNKIPEKVMSIILNNLGLIESEDIMKMYSMIYYYFNSDYDAVFEDSTSVEEFIDMYYKPQKTDNYKSFADLLLEELKKRTNE